MGHRFGWSGRPGIDRCRCGTERELREELNPPFRPYWWFRLTDPKAIRACGHGKATLVESQVRELWPCPARARTFPRGELDQ